MGSKPNSGSFKKGQTPWIKGKKHTEESRRKQRLAHLGKKPSEETRKKMSESNSHYFLGKKLSKERRKKLSESHKGQTPWNKGTKGTEESRRKQRLAHLGKKPSEETRKKISIKLKGKTPWNKGKKIPTPWMKGKTPWNKGTKGISPSGKDHGMYGRKVTAEAKQQRAATLKKKYPNGMPGQQTKEYRELKRRLRLYQVFPPRDNKFELSFQSLLREKGIEFEKHKSVLGQPDIFIKPNMCIFLDGDFHHANPTKYPDDSIIWKERISKRSGKPVSAITAKMIRDKDELIRQKLIADGYEIVQVWWSDWQKDPKKCLQKIIKIIKKSKPTAL